MSQPAKRSSSTRDRDVTTRVVMIIWSKRSWSVDRSRPGRGIVAAHPARLPLVGPAQVQAAAQEAIFVGHALGEPEILGIVPEIAYAEELDGDDAGGVHVLVVDAGVDGLGVRSGRGRGACGDVAGAGRLDVRGPGDAGRAEHLVRLTEDPERPVLAAGVGMIALGLLLVGVADLAASVAWAVTPRTLCGSISKLNSDTSNASLGSVESEGRLWRSVARGLPAVGQPAPQVRRAGDVALLDAELGAAELLEERRLGLDEQLVDGGDRQVVDQAQVDSHPDAREQEHRLLAGDRLGGLEHAVGAADLVVQVLPALGQQGLAGRSARTGGPGGRRRSGS